MRFNNCGQPIFDLVADLMIHLRVSNCATIRKFVVLLDPNQPVDYKEMYFILHATEENEFVSTLQKLLSDGDVIAVDTRAPHIYQMTDAFAEELLDGWPDRRWPLADC